MSVEFCFDNIMYRQIDGVSMWFPLGPALANIFVGFHERWLLTNQNKSVVYFYYVDDTFCLFNNETGVDLFFNSLKYL